MRSQKNVIRSAKRFLASMSQFTTPHTRDEASLGLIDFIVQRRIAAGCDSLRLWPADIEFASDCDSRVKMTSVKSEASRPSVR